jgi:hypothetical protein
MAVTRQRLFLSFPPHAMSFWTRPTLQRTCRSKYSCLVIHATRYLY